MYYFRRHATVFKNSCFMPICRFQWSKGLIIVGEFSNFTQEGRTEKTETFPFYYF